MIKLFTVCVLAVVGAGLIVPDVNAGMGDGKRGMMGKGGGKFGGKKGRMRGQTMQENAAPATGLKGAFMAMQANESDMDARGFIKTGLRPAYPDGLNCLTANSFLGSTTRGDGSTRSHRFYKGRHGGLDIPAKGVDIIAMADGEVVEKSEGENIAGIRVIVRHAPEDTGLPLWTFTEYKHLKEPSPQALHARVKRGDVLGVAWNTGTTGGRAYGPEGHYHLHLSAWYNATGEYKITPKMLLPIDGYWLDPLAMMRGGPLVSSKARDLADADKNVRFAYQKSDGSVVPPSAKIIWPFVCH